MNAKPHTIHREYAIQEDHWVIGDNVTWVTFSIYDEEGEFLHEARTLDKAKDWIDAEQAGGTQLN